ncbi:excinuclease ABC subunit A [Pseudophaeobacter flagellatus]|uniref:excinuclease ABC subunit A n=1 Tax=Pseudophaeobacter flagellatus TaxID=2899119 RepID=UPI001E5CAAB2|nr:excinuclease ABC subunit A [Pseudophaeobacter flagellatus]MCD9147721.1 excinuclease ABC subunit A [Pseudophaeobacter flagellatus]
MTQEMAISALKLAAFGSVCFGLALVLALITPLQGFFDLFFDLVHYPLDGQQALTSDSGRVLAAITGGLLVGLGAMVWCIAQDIYPQDPATGGRIILIGVWTWYLPDSFGSVIVGAWFNVVLNTGFLALFVLPILLHRQSQRALTS